MATKGQRRNEFLLGNGPSSVMGCCEATVKELKKQDMKLSLAELLSLAYQRGVADALDAEDGKFVGQP